MNLPNLSLAAAQAVLEVVDRTRALNSVLATYTENTPAQQRARFHEICYGACRYYHYFDGILAQMLHKPIAPSSRVVHFILVNACYQLEYMRTPEYAVVDQSVDAVKASHFCWADKLVNGVLRNFIKHHDQLKQALTSPSAQAAFPPWLHHEICTHWPEHYPKVFVASNCKPPLTVRINQLKTSRVAYLEHLAQSDIAATPTQHSELGVTLQKPLPVEKIPGFADGLVTVQDEASQLALAALTSDTPLRKGERVLDGCAAPGGKTCLLLEAQPEISMVAVDVPARIATLQQNLTRLGLDTPQRVKVVAADVTTTKNWWDGQRFARILLDVPCSGSGVIRRHPDIKHRRRPQDIAKFARQQVTLLTKTWPLLADGGVLLYATCSILPAENDAVVAQFIRQQHDAQPQTLDAPVGITTKFGRQRLPGVHPGDGFYYCLLKKHGSEKSRTKNRTHASPVNIEYPPQT